MRLKVYGSYGKAVELEVVDPDATFTKVPKEMADSLGLKFRYGTGAELADGRRIKRGLAGAEVELKRGEEGLCW